MAISAAIKYTQGVLTAPAGVALIGLTSNLVTCSNGNDTGVATWDWTLLSVPIGSALVPGVLGNTPSVSFMPDVDGCYLVQLDVTDGGVDTATDQRAFGTPDARGWLIPAFGGGAEAHNFQSQLDGWAGPDALTPPPPLPLASVKLIDAILAEVSQGFSGMLGDVTGDIFANVVGALRGTPLDVLTGAAIGDVLTWDGALWTPQPGGGGAGNALVDTFATIIGILPAGTPVYVKVTGDVGPSDASGLPVTHEVIGLVQGAGGLGMNVVTHGVCPYAPGGLTPGQPLYLAPGGGISASPPPPLPTGVAITRVGTARPDGISISVNIQVVGET